MATTSFGPAAAAAPPGQSQTVTTEGGKEEGFCKPFFAGSWSSSDKKLNRKKSSRLVAFKLETAQDALGIHSSLNPPRVKENSSSAFDRMPSSGRSTLRASASFGNYDKIEKLTYEGRLKEALDILELMTQQTSEATHGGFICLLKGCAKWKALVEGRQVHGLIVKTRCDTNIFLSNLLIGMYGDCGSVAEALKVFVLMPQHNVFSWTAMISAYAKSGQYKEAVNLFQQMHQAGIEPDEVACVVALKACTNVTALEQGQLLHSIILKKGFDSNVIVQNCLVDMYAKCGCLKDARELFDNMTKRDVISWNAMITGYAQKGFGKEALDLYEQMKHERMEPDNITLLVLLKACASISALQQGKHLHSLVLKKGLQSEMTIQNTLVDMYAKCGYLKEARALFDNMTVRNVVSWNAMIAGYAQKGFGKEALDLYKQMKHGHMEPGDVTLVLLLKACASVSALQQGKQLHSLIVKKGLESEMTIQTTLIDMYAKCGCLKDARELFDNMAERDLVSWNVMIAGYAQEGLGNEALDLFKQMKDEGLQAGNSTYICVLSACSHSGLVDEGRHIFKSISKDHGVTPTFEHYSCMVDLLGRAGCLSEAEDLILKMPIQPDETIWRSLLGAARKYVNVEIGRRAFEHIVELEPENAGPYLLLTDIYSAAGRMDEVARVRNEMNDKGLR